MNTGIVIFLGLAIVFAGLICIVLLCKIMGILVAISENRSTNPSNVTSAPSAVGAAPSAKAPNPARSPDPAPRSEIIAAVSAVIAEELGEDVSAIKILSLKKIN